VLGRLDECAAASRSPSSTLDNVADADLLGISHTVVSLWKVRSPYRSSVTAPTPTPAP
jgi:hypothetical protein